ncbi:MAG: hypothetical protein JO153_15385 [Solirubrobacterales bacterium]|nr:hypothetical protein [Solirubrobacterales bacterium]
MAKSSRRNKSEGTLDRIGGSVMGMFGKLTGRNSKKAKGKAARTRGSGRVATGRAKSQASRTKSQTKGRAKSQAKSGTKRGSR